MRNSARRLVAELGEQAYRKQLHALEVKEVKVRGQWNDADLDQGRALHRLKTARRKLERVREERAQVIPFPDPAAA
jgi:hypothetical protein